MALTEAALQAAIQSEGYGTDSATAQVEAIKNAWRKVCGLRRWSFLEATGNLTATIGSQTVAVTSLTDFGRPIAVRLTLGTEGYDLDPATPQELRNLAVVDSNNGTPEVWAMYAGALQLWPRPQSAYTLTVDYKKVATYNAADIVFPEQHQDVLKWKAIEMMAFRQRDWAALGYAKEEYRESLSEMKLAYGLEQGQNALEVAHSPVWSEVSH